MLLGKMTFTVLCSYAQLMGPTRFCRSPAPNATWRLAILSRKYQIDTNIDSSMLSIWFTELGDVFFCEILNIYKLCIQFPNGIFNSRSLCLLDIVLLLGLAIPWLEQLPKLVLNCWQFGENRQYLAQTWPVLISVTSVVEFERADENAF